MTSRPRYRLQAAERLRRAQSATAERALAQAQNELARVVQVRDGARRALELHLSAAQDDTVVENDGRPVRALELQRAAAFAVRQAERARALRAALAQAEAVVSACEAAVARCRSALGAAHASAQVIERDRERFERDARKHAERAEQLEIEEQHPATRGDRKPV